jgi:hypothetical protein
MKGKHSADGRVCQIALTAFFLVFSAAYAAAQHPFFPTPLTISEVKAAPGDLTLLANFDPGRSVLRGNILPGNSSVAVLMHHATTCRGLFQTMAKVRGSRLSGCIRGAYRPNGPIKIEILGLPSIDATANESGEFSFQDVPAGDHLLEITQGSRILALQMVSFSKTEPVVVNVTPRAEGIVTHVYLSEN